MVDFDIDKNLSEIPQEVREDIKTAVDKTYRRMRPCGESQELLFKLFKENIEPNYEPSCGKCRKRVINYWQQRLKTWKMI